MAKGKLAGLLSKKVAERIGVASRAHSARSGYNVRKHHTQRPIEEDYPGGYQTDSTGRLTHDIDGRPIDTSSRNVVGRAALDRPNLKFPDAELDELVRDVTGYPIQVVPRSSIGGMSGSTSIGGTKPRAEVVRVEAAGDLSPNELLNVSQHEVGHVGSELLNPGTRYNRYADGGIRIPPNLQSQAQYIFNDLNNSNLATRRDIIGEAHEPANRFEKGWTPQKAGYHPDDAEQERVAEGFRAYFENPNYIKTVAPEFATYLRKAWNSNDTLRRFAHLNAIGGAGVLGAMSSEDAEAGVKGEIAGALARRAERMTGESDFMLRGEPDELTDDILDALADSSYGVSDMDDDMVEEINDRIMADIDESINAGGVNIRHLLDSVKKHFPADVDLDLISDTLKQNLGYGTSREGVESATDAVDPKDLIPGIGGVGAGILGATSSEDAEAGVVDDAARAALRNPNFRKWFDGSMIALDDNTPLEVFHHGSFGGEGNAIPTGPMHFGTQQAAIDRGKSKLLMRLKVDRANDGQFIWRDPESNSSSEIIRPGGFESPTQAYRHANEYIAKEFKPDEHGIMTRAYLSLNNPLRTDDMMTNDGWAEAIERAIRFRHDGIIYKNRVEDAGSDSFIAFFPNQIKSADKNSGAFDLYNPNIYKGVGGVGAGILGATQSDDADASVVGNVGKEGLDVLTKAANELEPISDGVLSAWRDALTLPPLEGPLRKTVPFDPTPQPDIKDDVGRDLDRAGLTWDDFFNENEDDALWEGYGKSAPPDLSIVPKGLVGAGVLSGAALTPEDSFASNLDIPLPLTDEQQYGTIEAPIHPWLAKGSELMHGLGRRIAGSSLDYTAPFSPEGVGTYAGKLAYGQRPNWWDRLGLF